MRESVRLLGIVPHVAAMNAQTLLFHLIKQRRLALRRIRSLENPFGEAVELCVGGGDARLVAAFLDRAVIHRTQRVRQSDIQAL